MLQNHAVAQKVVVQIGSRNLFNAGIIPWFITMKNLGLPITSGFTSFLQPFSRFTLSRMDTVESIPKELEEYITEAPER